MVNILTQKSAACNGRAIYKSLSLWRNQTIRYQESDTAINRNLDEVHRVAVPDHVCFHQTNNSESNTMFAVVVYAELLCFLLFPLFYSGLHANVPVGF